MQYDELPVGEYYQLPGLPHRVLQKWNLCSLTEELKMFQPLPTQEVVQIDRETAVEIMAKRWNATNTDGEVE